MALGIAPVIQIMLIYGAVEEIALIHCSINAWRKKEKMRIDHTNSIVYISLQ